MANSDLIRGGTVTVEAGGLTATGQGVSWGNLREGDFFGAHLGLSVPIESIVGNVLTLAYPWPGPSQDAAPYAIQPKGDVTRFQATVRQLIELLADGDLAAIAALTSAADTVPYFTGAGAAALMSVPSIARTFLGQNFLPVQQGGGEGMTPNKIRLGWSSEARLLGQVDGTPIGEVWSDFQAPKSLNSPGFCKLPNGVIIQWGYVNDGQGDTVVTFPLTFPVYPVSVGAIIDDFAPFGGAYSVHCLSISKSSVGFRKRINAQTGGSWSAATAPLRWLAVGF